MEGVCTHYTYKNYAYVTAFKYSELKQNINFEFFSPFYADFNNLDLLFKNYFSDSCCTKALKTKNDLNSIYYSIVNFTY